MRCRPLVILLPSLCLLACEDCCNEPVVVVPPPRPVSILVEVYDPVTNFVWENVGVRVVQAEQEWSQCTCVSPFEDWYLTNSNGQVLLDEHVLAVEEVGFMEDGSGRAMLGSRSFEDQATVLLEIGATGYMSRFVEVQLHWGDPDVFVAVPFN
jgi:hypothetical protein